MKKQRKKALAIVLGLILVSGFAAGNTAMADVAEPCEVHTYDYVCDTVCNICGYERNATHSYDYYGQNYYYHWQKCECGAKLDMEAHVYDDGEDLTCSVCDYVRHLEHEFNMAGSDTTHHWEECSCGETQHKEEHTFVDKGDAIWHWKECECGVRVEAAAHVWGEGREEGNVTYYTCSICGAEKRVNAQDGSEVVDNGEGDSQEDPQNPDNTGNENTGNEGDGKEDPGKQDGENTGTEIPDDKDSEPSIGKKIGQVVGGIIGGVVAVWALVVAAYFIYRRKKGNTKATVSNLIVEENSEEQPEEDIKVDLDILDRIEQIGESEEPKDTL